MAAVGETLRVRGYRECLRALNQVNSDVAKDMRAALKAAAEPVAADSRSRLMRYQGASLGTIGPRVTTQGVFVTQRSRKVSGLRGDFGALEMTKGLMPALEAHGDSIQTSVDDALGSLIASAGFH